MRDIPGTGKTIFSSQFVYEGLNSALLKDENGVYISFSESKAQFYTNSNRLGMNFEKFEKQNKFMFLDFVSLTSDGIEDAFEEILASIRTVKAKRVVLDSFSALSLAFKEQIEARTAIHIFIGKLMRAEGITSVMVTEVPYGKESIGLGIEESAVDGIIRLEHGNDDASPLYLQIKKMRGTKINKERYVCNIVSNKGLMLYPKQSIKMTFSISDERISSGIPGFDERIDGNNNNSGNSSGDVGSSNKGLVKGTLTAIVGSTGSSKSIFAFQFVAEGVRKHKDAGIFCSLEDSADEIRRMGKGYGYDMKDIEKNGLSILVYNPYEENPDAFIANLEAEIQKTKAKRLVIDGLAVLEYVYKKDMHIITKRISSLVHKYQITTMITIHTSNRYHGFQASGLNLSALFQNVILLKFIEVKGYLKRILILLKITAAAAQNDAFLLEFKTSSYKGGIEVIGPIDKDIREHLHLHI